MIDINLFGFTPTESLAYNALVRLGPMSGYALAKELNIARANAYQALNGLVKKGVADTIDDQRPQRYRPLRPDALLVKVVSEEAQKIDLLERQVAEVQHPAGATTQTVTGERALLDLATRTIAREPDRVACLGPTRLLRALNPAWRRREADARIQQVWVAGDDPGDSVAVDVQGSIPLETIEEAFGSAVFLLDTPGAILIASVDGAAVTGQWSTDPLLVGAARLTLRTLCGFSA